MASIAAVALLLAAAASRAQDEPDAPATKTSRTAPGAPREAESRQDKPTSCTLEIRITNLRPGRLPVGLLVFAHDDGFPMNLKDAERRAWVRPKDAVTTSVLVVVPALPPGRYAVSAYQDLNGNRELDRSFFGPPIEPYGASGQPKRLLGPPKFDDAAIEVRKARQVLEIPLSDGKH